MAVLAVGVAGALGASALGVSASIGFSVGTIIGGLLFNKSPEREGPRLGNLAVTSSAYGASVPICFGTLRIPGNIIWSSGIREVKTTETVGGKGGGQKVTNYTYFSSFALALAEGEGEGVLRIWADGKLIFDKTGTGTQVSKSSFRQRFYPGNETQLPDPLIESIEGVGNVPAHRGLCYMVFEDLALEDFGNRIPNMTVEVTFKRTPTKPFDTLDFITSGEGGYFSNFASDIAGFDWHRGYGYFLTKNSNPNLGGIRRFNLRTMLEDRQTRMSDITSTTPNRTSNSLFCGSDGFLYMTVGASNSVPIIKINPDSMKEVNRFGIESNNLGNTETYFAEVIWMAMVSTSGGGQPNFLLTGSFQNHVGVLNTLQMSYVWGAIPLSGTGQRLDEARVAGVVGGIVEFSYGEGWVLGSAADSSLNHNSLAIYRARITALGDVSFDKVKTFSVSEIEATATGFYGIARGFNYDQTDDSVIFQVRVSNGGTAGNIYTIKWRLGTGIVWKTITPILINRDVTFNSSRLRDSKWTVMAGTRIVQLDTVTGAITYDETWTPSISNNFQFYDSATDSIVGSTGGGDIVRIYLNRGAGQGATVGDIVAAFCDRVGLGSSDIDVSELTDVVPGYILTSTSSARDAIEPLAAAYFFEGTESDDQLKFVKLGKAPVATIDTNLLVPLSSDNSETWTEQRKQEVDLPERVNIVYMDVEADYQQNAQTQKRATHPYTTMFSKSQYSFAVPAAITSDTAKNIAARVLYSSWVERNQYSARLPSDYLRLDPTDVVTVPFPDGATFVARIDRINIGADLSLSLNAVSQEAASYTSALVADGGSGRPPQMLAGDPATQLFVTDTPLLRDIDDVGGIGSNIYLMAGGFGNINWPGAGVYKSFDGGTWALTQRLGEEIPHGATLNALGAPLSPFATDEENVLQVFMTAGETALESVTQEAMLNGANAALLIKANGEPEVIQFREVTPIATGGYTLRGLLRGRRGTDIFTGSHSAGETFILLVPSAVAKTTLALGDLGVERYWRGVGIGQLFDDAPTLARTNTGRDLKPYAVAQPKAVVSGSDIALSWVRRTRIGGELKDGTGTVPLAETSEAYEVDILDAIGGNVLRTLTSGTPSATYLSVDITTDFGSIPSLLSVVIYQMSGAIGRGFPRTVTLEVA